MTNPEGVLRREGTMLKVFWIIFILGDLTATLTLLLPMLDLVDASSAITSNSIGLVAISGFFAMVGLIGVVVLTGRQRKLKSILSGQGFIAQWSDPEAGVVLLSRQGFFWYGEFYTAKGYSCSIHEATLKGNQLHITYLMAKRGGQGKHFAQLEVPEAHLTAAQSFCDAMGNTAPSKGE